MDEIAEIVRVIGQQQGENSFYRVCYGLLKQLQDLVAQASDDLLYLSRHEVHSSSSDFCAVNQIAAQLRISLDNFEEQEKIAELALKELYVIKADDLVYPTKKEDFRWRLSLAIPGKHIILCGVVINNSTSF